MMSPFTAFGRITNYWAALRPLAPLLIDWPLRGPWPYYTMVDRFVAHFRYLVSIRNLVNLPYDLFMVIAGAPRGMESAATNLHSRIYFCLACC